MTHSILHSIFYLFLPEFGNFTLIIALLLSIGIGLFGVFPEARQGEKQAHEHSTKSKINAHHALITRRLVYTLSTLVLIAYGILTLAFLTNNFSVYYVAATSSLTLPWFYKLCAVWGGHEGSILLWLAVLSVWMSAVAFFSKKLPDIIIVRVLAILAWIAVGFLLFILFTSNPFDRILSNIPTNGRDLNPLLQDIGFLMHPPVLYMGYVGFSVPFALALAALWSGRWDAQWAAWSRPWALAAWCFLTVGITLGSWWAYRELGWGGWWFWDPVENASFMPWIVGTALLHSLIVTQKRNTFKAWTAFLAIAAFCLSLLGTFLVRSGVLTSVHAFAVDPSRGLFMLIFLFIVMSISFIVYTWRAVNLRTGESFSLLSRETFLMLNNVMLGAIMLTILLGTLYPLFIEALGLGKLSVGAPYFNTVFSVLMLPVLFIMGLGPLTYWRSMPLEDLFEKTRLAFLFCLTIGLLLPWLLFQTFHPGAALGLFLSLWIVIATLISHYKKRHWGMFFAHIGIAVSLAGIVVSSSYSVERNVLMAPGDSVTLSHYSIVFKGIKTLKGPNYEGIKGIFDLYAVQDKQESQDSRGSKKIQDSQDSVYSQESQTSHIFTQSTQSPTHEKSIAHIFPEKRYYPIQKSIMTDAGIDAGIFRDIYIAMGEGVKQHGIQKWVVRLYYKPLIRWIWAGGFLILFGGAFAVFGAVRRR